MAEIIRVKCDAQEKRDVLDFNGKNLSVYKGADASIEVALTQNGAHVLASEEGTVTAEIYYIGQTISDRPLWSADTTQLSKTHTPGGWKSNKSCLAAIALPSSVTEKLTGPHKLVIKHTSKEGLVTVHLNNKFIVQ